MYDGSEHDLSEEDDVQDATIQGSIESDDEVTAAENAEQPDTDIVGESSNSDNILNNSSSSDPDSDGDSEVAMRRPSRNRKPAKTFTYDSLGGKPRMSRYSSFF